MRLNEMKKKTIVETIQKKNRLAWLNSDNAPLLDIEFYYNHSGMKYVAPIIEGLLNAEKSEDEILSIVADVCLIKYEEKWNRLYETITNDYDTFNDYYKETSIESAKNKDSKTTLNTNINSSSNTNTSGEQNSSNKNDNSIYAFNSESSIPTDSSKSESKVNASQSNINESNSSTDTATNTLEDKSGNTENKQEITKGKIGSTSYAELARKEVDFRLLHNFIEIFLNDISSEMCLSIY